MFPHYRSFSQLDRPALTYTNYPTFHHNHLLKNKDTNSKSPIGPFQINLFLPDNWLDVMDHINFVTSRLGHQVTNQPNTATLIIHNTSTKTENTKPLLHSLNIDLFFLKNCLDFIDGLWFELLACMVLPYEWHLVDWPHHKSQDRTSKTSLLHIFDMDLYFTEKWLDSISCLCFEI